MHGCACKHVCWRCVGGVLTVVSTSTSTPQVMMRTVFNRQWVCVHVSSQCATNPVCACMFVSSVRAVVSTTLPHK